MDARRNDEVATKRDVNQLKQELIERIDANSINIEANGKKIEANSKKIEANGKKIEANGKKIEANSKKIEANGKKIEANGKKIESNGKKIDTNSEKIDANGKKIDVNSEKISRLIDQVVENHTAIGKMVTREEYRKDYDRLLQGQDNMMVILLRLDQERVVTNARLDRLEADTQELKAR